MIKMLLNSPYCDITITTNTSLAFVSGNFVILTAVGSDSFVYGKVVSYNPSTGEMVITPYDFYGEGEICSWEVNVSGISLSGTSGTSGSSGTSASSGTSGSSGTSASSGTSGSSGTSASSGTSGTDGSSGTSGTDGSSGTSASSGSSGTSATSGSSGTSGTSGTSASSGSSGSSGTSGTDGSSGTSATSGSSGTSATSGSSGTSATSGATGASGSSGTSGATGASGSSGTSGGLGAVIVEGIGYGSSVRTGFGNTATSLNSAALSGCNNSSTANCSVIVGGYGNTIISRSSFIGGGSNNCLAASSYYSVISGGRQNTIAYGTRYSTIGGGRFNFIQRNCLNATSSHLVGGGSNNSITGFGDLGVVVGGCNNRICNSCYGFIGGGRLNSIFYSSCSNVVGGYFSQVLYSCASNVFGGRYNCLRNNKHSSIVGGLSNRMEFSGEGEGGFAYYNVISGGCNNSISNLFGTNSSNTIGGGRRNHINGVYNSANYNVISGGFFNTIYNSSRSGMLGSAYNTITGAFNSFAIGNGLCLSGTNLLTCVNTLAKQAGSFAITHPDPAKASYQQLWHSFVESPTAGDNIYRFTVRTISCEASLKLPDYYKHLNKDTQVWIAPKDNFGAAHGTLDANEENINIKSNEDGLFNVLIIGTRKDKDATSAWKGVERNKEL